MPHAVRNVLWAAFCLLTIWQFVTRPEARLRIVVSVVAYSMIGIVLTFYPNHPDYVVGPAVVLIILRVLRSRLY